MDFDLFPPELMEYSDQAEFEFTTFLQEDDFILDDVLQGSSTSAGFSDSSNKVTPPSSQGISPSPARSQVVRRPAAQKQRTERRGHTKSRRGCFNCKRRRIKCQETHPACGHCAKIGLKCEYPAMPRIVHQPHNQIPLFSLQDMRFFQHFLTQCYPHHPLKQEDIWTHEVPCIAHNHEYLMHAILGFAASELRDRDPTVISAAMSHRTRAIRAIKKRLAMTAETKITHEEANALVATCYALTFQSTALDDGLAEFMTFIRGIMIVAMQMMYRGIKPIFENILEDEQDKVLAPLMEGLPLIEKGWVHLAKESIENLKPLCGRQAEGEYQEHLVMITEKLYIDSWDAYKQYGKQYGWWMLLPHHDFQEVINTSNQVMALLHTHWIALTQIMAFITQQEHKARDPKHERAQSQAQGGPDLGFIRWLKWLNVRVDNEHRVYNQWPMWVEEQLDKDVSFFGKMI